MICFYDIKLLLAPTWRYACAPFEVNTTSGDQDIETAPSHEENKGHMNYVDVVSRDNQCVNQLHPFQRKANNVKQSESRAHGITASQVRLIIHIF